MARGLTLRPQYQLLRPLGLLLLPIVLVACGPSPEQEQFALTFFERVRTDDFESLQSDLAPNLKNAEARSQLEALRREYVPAQAPSKTARIGWSFFSVLGGDTTATFVHRHDYPDRVLIVTTATRTSTGEVALVEGFHVNVTMLGAETEAAERFTFEGKSTAHLAFLGALICSVLLMVLACLGTLVTKGFGRKWLFAPLALVGAPVFAMNWTSGEWSAQFAISLINTGISRGMAPLDPWVVTFQLPVGALIVLSLLLPRWAGVASDDGAGRETKGADNGGR